MPEMDFSCPVQYTTYGGLQNCQIAALQCVWFDRVCINCGMSEGYRRKLEHFFAHIFVHFVLHIHVQPFPYACTDHLPCIRSRGPTWS